MLHKRQGMDNMTQSQPLTRVFRKSTPALIAVVMAVGLLAGASRGLAVNLTWTNGNNVWNSTTAWQTNLSTAYTNEIIGVVTNQVTNSLCVATLPPNSIFVTNCVGGTGGFPATGDTAFFTNSTSPNVTVTSSTNLSTLVFSNTFVTMSASASALTATNALRIAADNFTTATVYWAGGTLAVTNANHGSVIQIGTGTNSVGALFVTNGTLVCDYNTPGSSVGRGILLGVASAGKLVISGPVSS